MNMQSGMHPVNAHNHEWNTQREWNEYKNKKHTHNIIREGEREHKNDHNKEKRRERRRFHEWWGTKQTDL